MTTTIDRFLKLNPAARQAVETVADYLLRQAGLELGVPPDDVIRLGLTEVRAAVSCLTAGLSTGQQEQILDFFSEIDVLAQEMHPSGGTEARRRSSSDLLLTVGLELAQWRLRANVDLDSIDQVLSPPSIDLSECELLATWSHYGFTLQLYDTHRIDRQGKSILAYELFDEEHGEEPIFAGDDFHASPMHAIDSDATAASLLSFLSLRPGDTDKEYFDSYSTEQLKWCQARGDELALLAEELRQPYRPVEHHKIEHETWDEAHQAGRYNRALVLSYRERGGEEHRVTLSAGESDHVDVLTDGEAVYSLTVNFRLGYVGLERWVEGEDAGDLFFQNNVEAELGEGFWDLGTVEMLQRLVEHLG